MKNIVIIGGGFGGLSFLKAARKSKNNFTLIDQTNHHLFQPLLYQVATAVLSPSDITVPIRNLFKNDKNVNVVLDEVIDINQQNNSLDLLSGNIINYDKLTYAGNIRNLVGFDKYKNYKFIKADIVNYKKLDDTFKSEKIDSVIHFAAESHVDRSILDPFSFVKTNVLGTLNLLEVSKKHWKGNFNGKLFHHISTDEVFGSAEDGLFFNEKTPYDPHSPYSASKASADHLIKSYIRTYKFPAMISNCCNNYGPYQFPEKLIPKMISNILNNKTLPIYGKGINSREWIYVKDHCEALVKVYQKGKVGEFYNIGSNKNLINLEIFEPTMPV